MLDLVLSQTSTFPPSLWTHASLCLKGRDHPRWLLRQWKRKALTKLCIESEKNVGNQHMDRGLSGGRVLAPVLPALSSFLFPVRTVTPVGMMVPKPVVCSPSTEQTQTFWIWWSFRTRVGKLKCPFFFILSFHQRSSSWVPGLAQCSRCCRCHTCHSDIQWLLGMCRGSLSGAHSRAVLRSHTPAP